MNNSNSVDINGEKIRLLREQKEVTQLYLATVVGVTTDTISRWENRRYPSIKMENAKKLAEALEVPLEKLLDDAHKDDFPGESEVPSEPPPILPAAIEPVQARPTPFLQKKNILFGAAAALIVTLAAFLWVRVASVANGVESVRVLPPHTAPNSPFPVIIHVVGQQEGQNTLLIREELKGDCEASAPAAEGDPKSFGQNPRWIGKLDNGRAAFLYIVTPGKKLKQGDDIRFKGDTITREGQTSGDTIGGPASITLLPYHWVDADKDYAISDAEILKAYETYTIAGDTPLNFNEIEELWMAGHYAWNKKTTSFVPVRPGNGQE